MKNKKRGEKNTRLPSKKPPQKEDSDLDRKILLQLDEKREITKALSKLLEQFSPKK
ncbi:MAG: hypothetical protein PHW19_13170 [Salinivirgaceae bacterium]|nr:hypothetical protein [Salinivirgaceae bacterium]